MPPFPAHLPSEPVSERHKRILDAAERVFARAGFHVATMNDVAGEAGMSPGNLYRYFASKDAIIVAMAERDRTMIAADFAGLDPTKGPILDQLEKLGRARLADDPREKAIIALQIWAEAARDPAMASMCNGVDDAVTEGLGRTIAGAKATGELPADLDEGRFLQAIFMMADGLLCRRAVDPDFDAGEAVTTLFRAMRGLAQVLTAPQPGRTAG